MDDALAEAVRAARHVLDHEQDRLDAARSGLMRLMESAMMTLAGSLVGTALLVHADMAVAWEAVLLVAAGAGLQWGATVLAGGAGGSSGPMSPPGLHDMVLGLKAGTPAKELHKALLERAVVAHRRNQEALERLVRRRRTAGLLWLSGIGLVVLGTALVLGGAMLA